MTNEENGELGMMDSSVYHRKTKQQIFQKIGSLLHVLEKNGMNAKMVTSKSTKNVTLATCTRLYSNAEIEEHFHYTVKNRKSANGPMKTIEFTTYVNLQDRSWFQWKHVLWPTLKSDGIWLQQHPGPMQLIHNSTIAYVAMIHPRGEYVAGFQTALNTNLKKYVSEHKEEVTTLFTQYRI